MNYVSIEHDVCDRCAVALVNGDVLGEVDDFIMRWSDIYGYATYCGHPGYDRYYDCSVCEETNIGRPTRFTTDHID